jgi:hypothetical protein
MKKTNKRGESETQRLVTPAFAPTLLCVPPPVPRTFSAILNTITRFAPAAAPCNLSPVLSSVPELTALLNCAKKSKCAPRSVARMRSTINLRTWA